MSIHGIRLYSIGLIFLSTAFAGAQTKLVTAEVIAQPAAPPAAEPDVPKRPAEMPPKAPSVTCHGDQITISADNSTLQAILAGVKGCTGAHIDIPEGASRVRSFEELGPGPVRQVLDELLSGTQYNYVIQSSDLNPAKVEMVLLSMRMNGDKPAAVAEDIPTTGGRRAWKLMQKFDKPDISGGDENGSGSDDTPVAADNAVATPAEAAAAANGIQPPAEGSEASPSDASAAQALALTPIAPPVVEPGSNADPSKAMADRISSMQQLFDQRQKMTQKQTQTQSGAPNK